MRKVRRLGQCSSFRSHTPDAAVCFVAVGMPEARLVMADDGVVPITYVERAIRAELHIDGAKGAIGSRDQRLEIFQREPRAIFNDAQSPNRVINVTTCDELALPFIWKMRCAHNVRAAHFSAVAIAPDERWRFDLSTRDEAGHGIDRRTVVPRHHDRFAPIREDVPPRILRLVFGAIERLELQTLRP